VTVTTPEPSGEMDERMRALPSLDIQRNAILMAAIDASVQTVREDVRRAQEANVKMFNVLRQDMTDWRTETNQRFAHVEERFTAQDTKFDEILRLLRER
jgi:hypothetical protein